MPRQIIKTRPQRPYIVARIAIVAIVVITILVAIAYAVAEHRARTHNVAGRTWLLSAESLKPHHYQFTRVRLHASVRTRQESSVDERGA